jgi:hypothetical protein
MRAKLMFPLGAAFAAAIFAQAEGTFVARWGADRSTACSGPTPAGGCALNGTISIVAGTFFAVETLAAVLVALVLARSGKRLSAGVALAALVAALALEHVWLLT